MSEETNFKQPLREVRIDSNSIQTVQNLIEIFNLQVDPKLTDFLSSISGKRSFTLEEQNKLRVMICEMLISNEHPMFKDELLKTVVDRAKQIAYEAAFEEQLHATLTSDEPTT
jgi:hypothetical protein